MHCKIYGHKIGGLGYAGMGGMVHFAGVFAVLFFGFWEWSDTWFFSGLLGMVNTRSGYLVGNPV